MTFIADFQLLSPCLRQIRFLWLSLQILNYGHFTKGRLNKFYITIYTFLYDDY